MPTEVYHNSTPRSCANCAYCRLNDSHSDTHSKLAFAHCTKYMNYAVVARRHRCDLGDWLPMPPKKLGVFARFKRWLLGD